MADVGDNNFVRYIYRGEDGERIPLHVTHVTVHELATAVLAGAFEKIEQEAFYCCPSLRRVIMPGVTIVEEYAFYGTALTDVECGKLERIEEAAFENCTSLRTINLPSAEIVEYNAFRNCIDLTGVKFGNKLERIEKEAFGGCSSLNESPSL